MPLSRTDVQQRHSNYVSCLPVTRSVYLLVTQIESDLIRFLRRNLSDVSVTLTMFHNINPHRCSTTTLCKNTFSHTQMPMPMYEALVTSYRLPFRRSRSVSCSRAWSPDCNTYKVQLGLPAAAIWPRDHRLTPDDTYLSEKRSGRRREIDEIYIS